MASSISFVNSFSHLHRSEYANSDRFVIPGIAAVEAQPFRRIHEAEALAQRIAQYPARYLALLTGAPGVHDLRPISHARGGSPFGAKMPPLDAAIVHLPARTKRPRAYTLHSAGRGKGLNHKSFEDHLVDGKWVDPLDELARRDGVAMFLSLLEESDADAVREFLTGDATLAPGVAARLRCSLDRQQIAEMLTA